MLTRTMFPALLAGTTLTVSSCAPAVRSDRDESIPVPRGATWAFSAPEAGDTTQLREPAPERDGRGYPRYGRGRMPQGPGFDDEIFLQRLRRAMETTLQNKGLAKTADPAQADFLLSVDVAAAPPRRGAGLIGVGVGFGRPWGYYRPYGFYRPWGWFVPWGWGLGWYDWYGGPMGGPRYAPYRSYGGYGYGDGRIGVSLRQRSSGNVAFRATYALDIYDLQRTSQSDAQRIAEKLLKDLP